MGDAVGAHSTASDQCEALLQLPSPGIPAPLCELAEASLARASAAQVPPVLPACSMCARPGVDMVYPWSTHLCLRSRAVYLI